MKLLLFSGFLGSGKTTLVLRVIQQAIQKGFKPAILVNEIGEVGIDNQLMRQLDLDDQSMSRILAGNIENLIPEKFLGE